jgi:hypothetical protein
MARARTEGNGRLEEAIAILLQNQATFVQNQAAFLARIAEMDRVSSERFARIEALLLEHSRILAEHGRILTEHTRILADHTRILQALPDAVRDKIGFKVPGQPG